MDFQEIAQLGTKVFAADAALTVEFYMNAQLDEKATEAAGGVPQYVDKPFVKIYVPGDQFNVVDQPAWIDARHPNAHNNRFPKQWAAFKANEAQVSDGMPLKDFPRWPSLSERRSPSSKSARWSSSRPSLTTTARSFPGAMT
jgi:hypothetical protein